MAAKKGKFDILHYRLWEKGEKIRVYFDEKPGTKIGLSFFWDKDTGMSVKPGSCRAFNELREKAEAFCKENFGGTE